ncbi:multiple sugar transport system ATP-binding protein [Stella humosa]|uniref:Multiple sugar transport system ATP-binding protein n=1 Tax=Stella humosa TaxID=94 RepID=A0A3N1LGS8_9PROT|nr:sn-glycerol-3-phosphate ABC transporter ATP-binding protein UgpC [Stella humosa]ROP90622.1 multiple sugar transport system ATP-binding protein [Stella humosa]BBK29482.1 sugar ABC transporter ATP-binding protein [Stella humosa]
MATLELRGLAKSFGRTPVLAGLDLAVADGELVVLVGPSGCGKSTLLRLVAGLEDATAGDILLDGRSVIDVPAADRGAAMVFQSYALYPHQTVYGNLAFPLKMARRPRAELDAKVRAVAALLNIDGLLDRLPRELSGGQRQRVAMGRAMIREPRLFLFDEPLSNLDVELRVRMRLEIGRLQRELGVTTLYVTHDQTEAMTLADRIVVLRAGNVEQIGTPMEVYHQPATRFVAGFMGTPPMNFLPVKTMAEEAGGTRFTLGPDLAVTLPVRLAAQPEVLGIRPEHIHVAGPDEPGRLPPLSHTKPAAEHLGERSYGHANTVLGEIALLLPAGGTLPDETQALALALDVAALHAFAADGSRVEVRAA